MIRIKYSIIVVLCFLCAPTFASKSHSDSESCKNIVTSESKTSTRPLSAKVIAKYNVPKVLSYNFTSQSLEQVKAGYHMLPVPKLLVTILDKTDPDTEQVLREVPDYFTWNQSGDSLITINPSYTSPGAVAEGLRDNDLFTLKDREGVSSIIWYVHPNLINQIESSSNKNITIAEIETESIPNLVTILDLEFQHIEMLQSWKEMALEYLRDKFGVVEGHDDIRLDFHFPYAFNTATLHLHARVNTPGHPLELSKSYSIDNVIGYLREGKDIKQLILDQQEQYGSSYFPLETGNLLSSLGNGEPKEVDNPFRIDSLDESSQLISVQHFYNPAISRNGIYELGLNYVNEYLPNAISVTTNENFVRRLIRSVRAPFSHRLGQWIRNGETETSSYSDFSFLNPDKKYNFVISDDKLTFTEIENSLLGNELSKHLVLALGSQNVRFSGELWFEDGVLHISNNSGTFQPLGSDLVNVARLLRKTFGDRLKIKTHNWESLLD